MASLNKVTLIGRLGDDPKISNMTNGSKVANMTVATTDTWKDKASGEKKERTEWHKVVIFNPALCDVAEKYLHKGDNVYIEGQLQTRKYSDSNGVEKFVTEIVLQGFSGNIIMLSAKKDSAKADEAFDKEWEAAGQKAKEKAEAVAQSEDVINDEIPF